MFMKQNLHSLRFAGFLSLLKVLWYTMLDDSKKFLEMSDCHNPYEGCLHECCESCLGLVMIFSYYS